MRNMRLCRSVKFVMFREVDSACTSTGIDGFPPRIRLMLRVLSFLVLCIMECEFECVSCVEKSVSSLPSSFIFDKFMTIC